MYWFVTFTFLLTTVSALCTEVINTVQLTQTLSGKDSIINITVWLLNMLLQYNT